MLRFPRLFSLRLVLFSAFIALGLFMPGKAFGVSSITVIVGANGTGTQDANLTIDGLISNFDPDIGGNTLSTGALLAIGPFTALSVASNGPITFNDLGGTVTLQAQIGIFVTFNAQGTISFVNPANTLATSGGFLEMRGNSVSPANLSAPGAGIIFLKADNLNITQSINGGSGVAIEPRTTTQNIDLGGADSAGILGLTDVELDNITAAFVRIGQIGSTGNITVKSTISAPAGWSSLSLLTTGAGTITQQPGADLQVPNVAARAGASVNLGNFTNAINTIAGQVNNLGGSFVYKGIASTLTIGTVVGIVGIGTNQGFVNVENVYGISTFIPGSLIVNNAVNTNSGPIFLFADNMTFNAAVNAGNQLVVLDVDIFSRPITLGTKPGTSLGLLQSDLNQVTAGRLRVGDETLDTGGLTITAAITAPATWNTLDLRSKANISGSGAGPLTVPNLIFTDGTNVARTWTIGPGSVTESPNSEIPISGVTNLTINGGSAADIFNVTPGPSTTMQIKGGSPAPPALPGDTLNVNTAGISNFLLTKNSLVSGFQGNYTFGNRQPLNFSEIETLNPACPTGPPTIVCPGSFTKYADPGQNTATFNLAPPAANSDCGSVAVAGTRSDGKALSDPYPLGLTIITWRAIDPGNNTTFCNQSILIMQPSGQRRAP